MTSKQLNPKSEGGGEMREAFGRDGFLPPFALFTRPQCALVQGHFRWGNPPAASKWSKGQAVSDTLVFDLATRPGLFAWLRPLLGDDIILWGASWLTREPKQIHPWHCDIESSAPEGGFVSVWIGIENTSRESALQLIRGSHEIGKTIQQVAHERGFRRGEVDAATALNWARETISSAEFAQPEMNDGDALVFDGRLWHGSENTRLQGTRSALLYQYAAAGKSVKMPDLDHLEWPFRYKSTRVPLLAVSGKDARTSAVAPPSEDVAALRPQFHQMNLPLRQNGVAPWKAHPLFEGETPNVTRMSTHYSVLLPGHSPHSPHAHREEEILVVIDGEAELVIGQHGNGAAPRSERLQRGSFVFYPAFQFHTIRNASSSPVTYLMFKWTGRPREVEMPLETIVIRPEATATTQEAPFATDLLFEGPTHYLAKLHAHFTQLQPQAGYKAHADSHDVAIVTLSGSVATAGRRLGPDNVIYFPAGDLHGMNNPAPESAHYLAFEFHGALPGEEDARLRFQTQPEWQKRARRVYRRVRQKAAATSVWRRLRPIYRKFR
jgi:mannose-6-phosphate isomerase-like protein (cupin superfamily)